MTSSLSHVDAVTVGETMASFRAAGPLRLGGTAMLSIAGAESNVAIGLARLGHVVRWAGRVGDDELGELILRTLRAENVDVSYAATDPARPTGLIVFEPGAGHLMRAHYYRANSAGSAVAARDVLAALDPPPRVLHVTGITPALGQGAAEAVLTAMRYARPAGTRVCLDVNYRSRLWAPEQARAALRSLAPYADILIASVDELPLLAQDADPLPSDPAEDHPGALARTARQLLGDVTAEVVITRGAAGATVITTGQVVSLPAHRVPVADVVGAGDAFAAGYLSGYLDGLGTSARLARAITTSAFAVSTMGDWEGLPTRADLTRIAASRFDVSGDTTLR